MPSLLSLAVLTAVPALAAPGTPNCFPYGSATLPSDGSVPQTSLDQWWCPRSMAYGFQGFSYALEDGDCSSAANSFEQMDQDFAQMRSDFDARVVRMYYPLCTQSSVFENALMAAAKNNMALIFQVWTNFGVGDVWKDSQQAIYDVLDNPQYSALAPYIVHWADFGSEPVGDGMDSGNFVDDLGEFQAKMHQHNILAGISEDWDRPGVMSSSDGSGLGPIGAGVRGNSDYAHIHPMPFYHSNGMESEAWAYIKEQIEWVVEHVQLPIFVTETQWAWGPTYHYPDHQDLGVQQYTDYWKTFDDNCEWFKEKNVGWFLHDWRGEQTFDIIDPNGGYIIPDWKPRKC